MQNDIKEILFTEEEIAEKVKELGQQISKDYSGENLTVVGILRVLISLWGI